MKDQRCFDIEELEDELRLRARKLTSDPDDIEDLISEGWLAVVQAESHYRPGELSKKSWLLQRAEWRMRDWMRKEKRHRCVSLDEETGKKMERYEDRRRRIVVHVTEGDCRILEEMAKEAGGDVTVQDVVRAAIRLMAFMREENAADW